MENQFDSLLKIINMILDISKANPYMIGGGILLVSLGYGWLQYKYKKWQREQILIEQDEDRESNLDDLENETQNSNSTIRDRLRTRR